MHKALRSLALPLSFALALAATLGSLYAQYVGFAPCVLCWWQRIFLYPLLVLIPIGLWKKDRSLPFYLGALALIGAGIALYHTLLYYGILPEAAAPCDFGVPCTAELPSFLGLNFITASLGTFLAILALQPFALKSYESE